MTPLAHTSTRDGLLALAKCCEEAEGPSYLLECDIADALGKSHKLLPPPPYTASLDAALTLVPNGWMGSLAIAGRFDCWAELHDRDEQHPRCKWGHCTEGQTPALALCAAALRARAAIAKATPAEDPIR